MSNRFVHLDFARGMAALAVCAGHLRAFQFTDYTQVIKPTWFDNLFYFATGFGHQAVMVFFVLSGFLIGGSVADNMARNRWSWLDYGIRRLARLWVVLIPALIMTCLWDSIGRLIAGGNGYDGAYYGLVHSGPPTAQGAPLGITAFLGNCLFLQTIRCPVYGTNGPLWSLANEFWYYLLFPMAWLTISPLRPAKLRTAAFLVALAIGVFLPGGLLLGGLIWLMGYGAYSCVNCPGLRRLAGNSICFAGFVLVFMAGLWMSRNKLAGGSDFLIGFAFAGMLPFLVIHQAGSSWYHRMCVALSGVSYTLYLVHFPFLAFLFFCFALPHRSAPSLPHYLLYAGLLLGVLGYAGAIWWFFERRTDAVRKFVQTLVNRTGNFPPPHGPTLK